MSLKFAEQYTVDRQHNQQELVSLGYDKIIEFDWKHQIISLVSCWHEFTNANFYQLSEVKINHLTQALQ